MIWPTQCNCLHEGQLDHSPCRVGMCSEHQHQARTDITKFGCLELNCSLNIHKIVYVLPPFLPRLSRTERFYSCALPNLFRMGFLYWFTAGIILLLPDLIAETLFSPKCIQSVAGLLFFTGILCCNIREDWIPFRQVDFWVHFYSKDFPRDASSVLFIALPSFSSPSCSHLLVFHSSHIFSLRLWFRASFVKEQDSRLEYFQIVTVNQGLHRCLESPVVVRKDLVSALCGNIKRSGYKCP